jgi:hypothetical protein
VTRSDVRTRRSPPRLVESGDTRRCPFRWRSAGQLPAEKPAPSGHHQNEREREERDR